jgi:hypothetical protein
VATCAAPQTDPELLFETRRPSRPALSAAGRLPEPCLASAMVGHCATCGFGETGKMRAQLPSGITVRAEESWV